MKKSKPNINKLPRKTLIVGDLVSFTRYASASKEDFREIESHGIVVESALSIIKIRPLADFSNIILCNVADCRLVKKEER